MQNHSGDVGENDDATKTDTIEDAKMNETEVSGRSPFTSRCFEVVVVAMFMIAATFLMAPVLNDPAHRLISSVHLEAGVPTGDQAFFLHALWWVAESVTEGNHPWFTPLMGAPVGLSLRDSTIVPLLAFVLTPMTRIAGEVLTFNFICWIGFWLLPWGTYRLLRVMKADRHGALLGAAFMFFPVMLQAHMAHLNLISAWVVPWALVFYWRLMERPCVKNAMWAALGLALVFYTSAYLTVDLVIIIAMDILRRLWLSRRAEVRQAMRPLVKPAIIGFLVSLPFVTRWPYIVGLIWGLSLLLIVTLMLWDHVKQGLSKRYVIALSVGAILAVILIGPFFVLPKIDPRVSTIEVTESLKYKFMWSTQTMSYLLGPGMRSWFVNLRDWGQDESTFRYIFDSGDFNVFPGYVIYGLIFLMLLHRRARLRGSFFIGVALLFAVFSMGPLLRWGMFPLEWGRVENDYVVMPAILLENIPLLQGVRVFARFGAWAGFCLVLAVGLGWRPLIRWLRLERYSLVLVLALGLLGLIERLPYDEMGSGQRWPLGAQVIEIPEVYDQLKVAVGELGESEYILEFPNAGGHWLYPLTRHQLPMMNEYTSRRRPGLDQLMQENAFAWLVYSTGILPTFIEDLQPPPMTEESLRAGFEAIAPAYILIDKRRVDLRERAGFVHVCKDLGGMETVFESPDYLLLKR